MELKLLLRDNLYIAPYRVDKFEFDFELLGLEQKFIDHALKSYENTTGNFGILLNGVKGTGKF